MAPSRMRSRISKFFSDTKSWRSWQLRSWWMILMISLHAGFVAAVATLLRISETQSGFANVELSGNVNTFSALFSRKIWVSQFRWTLLPGLVLSLLAMGYGTMVNASAQRQPFVELVKRKKAKNAKLTILLDYPSQWALYRWAAAIRNGHVWLGLAMLVQLVVSVLIGPLGSNLFKTKDIVRSVPIALGSPLGFDLQTLQFETNPGTAIEIANAVHVNGATPPQWTTEQYAISPFVATKGQLSGLVTAVTEVYYASLDCRLIPRSEMDVVFESNSLPNSGYVKIGFTDRSCDIEDKTFAKGSEQKYFAITWQENCQGFSPFTDRLGVFIGTFAASSPDELSRLISVSCIPSYHNATASVGMYFENGKPPKVDSVDVISSSKLISLNFRRFESGLPLYTIFDNSASVESDSFGQTVYEYASKVSGANPPDASAAQEATQAIYSTMFAALIPSKLFSPRRQVQPVSGKQSLNETRLYVVPPVAYVLLALLGLMFICSIGLFALALGRDSILKEEPQGLLGSASLLFESDIFKTISEYHAQPTHPEELVEYVKKHYSTKNAKCWYVEAGQPHPTQSNAGAAQQINAAGAPAQGSTGTTSSFIHVESLEETSPTASPNVMRRMWNGVKRLFH